MIYFDNGATSFPKPQEVYREVMRAMTDYGANPGRSGHKLALEASRAIHTTRSRLKDLLQAESPMELIFTKNCTEALNLPIKGLLKKGDHVVTTSMEHNSVLRPIKALEKIGVENTIVYGDPRGIVKPKDIEAALRPNTRLIVTTHISNLTGTILDIVEIGNIARSHGIYYLVDGAQSAGVYDVDLTNMPIDLFAFPGHKGLLGPQGTGGLYIRGDIYKELRELLEGGTGSVSDSLIQPELLPDKYESGTPNTPGIAGLGEGVKFILDEGIDKIRKKEEDLLEHFIEEIKKIPEIIPYGPLEIGKQAPVLALNVRGMDSSFLSFKLDDSYNIAVRPGIHCAPLAHETIGTIKEGAVRFSFGYTNTHEEIEIALRALKEIIKEG